MKLLGIYFILFVSLLSCGSEEPLLSSESQIVSFNLTHQARESVIDTVNRIVTVEMNIGRYISGLRPMIEISEGATIEPESHIPQNFYLSVFYTITAEDGTAKQWEVRPIHSIYGNWQINRISGGFFGLEYDPINFDVVNFSSDGTYTVFFNNDPVRGGSLLLYGVENLPHYQQDNMDQLMELSASYLTGPRSNFYIYESNPVAVIFSGSDTVRLFHTGPDVIKYQFVRQKDRNGS